MKTKIFLLLLIFSFAGLLAQQKAKMQKADESGLIDVDEVPVLKSQIKPAYPQIAKLAGIEGTVYLKLLIDEKGNVAKAKVEQGVKDMIDEAALVAAKNSKFSPAILNNKPVKVWVILPIAFKLEVDKKAEGKLIKYDELGPLPSNLKGEDPDINAFISVEKMPEMREAVTPVYPAEAKKNKITGKVFVKVLVDKEGNPKRAIVIKSESELFNQPAVDAAMKSKFSPALDKGNPIAVWILLPYKFSLDGETKDNQKGSAKQFNTVELAKDDYKANIYMYENKKNREAIGAPKGMTFEKIDSRISFGDESAIYKMTGEKSTGYVFVARKGAKVYNHIAQTLVEVQKYVDDLMSKEK